MSASAMPGQVFGTPGGSLKAASWATSASAARTGRRGEAKTGVVLAELAAAPGGPSVLHDLRIPIPGIQANIDHVVISASTVTIVDSKVWAPGRYRNTVWGRGAKRDGERVDHVRKQTMVMAREAVAAHLARLGVEGRLSTPLVVVWPSRPGPLSMTWLSVPGARVVQGETFARRAARVCGSRTADGALVAALTPLVHGAGS